MNVLLAAVDASAAAQPVLDVARELARLLGTEVETVHVAEPNEPDVVRTVHALVEERDAAGLVVGARGAPGGASPAGHVTTELVQTLDVPVAVVPPQARPRPIQRVLVGVEGNGESPALQRVVANLRGSSLEIVALHVFEPDRLPLFGDQPVLETEAWADEFERRALRGTTGTVRTEARVGVPPHAIRRAAAELDSDLVVVAWHRALHGGHGRVVRGLLEDADLPVLLIPLATR